jgi:hypothetical protein
MFRHRDDRLWAGKPLAILLVSFLVLSCALNPSSVANHEEPTKSTDGALRVQALVMELADRYIAALGEAIYLIIRSGQLDAKGRWLAQSFLRNGVGASMDIAVGPNPAISLMDLLVLTSLQSWSFEAHWIPGGIGEAGRPAAERLKRTKSNVWANAEEVLSKEQLRTLRRLIDAWIAENPNQTVVSLVRFNEFVDERKISSLEMRGEAHGLMEKFDLAIATVDETRLLGERLLWFAGRYPYLFGEQTELTAYRLMDQPESAQLFDAIAATQRLGDVLAARIETLPSDLEKQQVMFFERISNERNTAINQFFNRMDQEWDQLVEDISTRQGELLSVMTELQQTIAVSGTLAKNLTETVNAIGQMVSHFDRDPNDNDDPLRMTDVRDAAIETGHAADRVTILIERAIALLESNSWDQRLSTIDDPAEEIVDRFFWRGVILIGLLVAGMGLLRMIPQRFSAGRKGNSIKSVGD